LTLPASLDSGGTAARRDRLPFDCDRGGECQYHNAQDAVFHRVLRKRIAGPEGPAYVLRAQSIFTRRLNCWFSLQTNSISSWSAMYR
jgi:hypothetical protein